MTCSNYDFVSAKEEYRQFCQNEHHDIQIFALPWYLDAASGSPDEWSVITYKEGGKIVAAFPFRYIHSKKGVRHISNPGFSPRLGLWIDYGNRNKSCTREAFENKVTKYIIDNLPPFDIFDVYFDDRYKNWRVFYDNGFSQETRYSYLVTPEQAGENYLSTISGRKRSHILKASSAVRIRVSEDIADVDRYMDFYQYSYKLRGRMSTYSESAAKKLICSVLNNRQGKLYFAEDINSGAVLAQSFIPFDEEKCYGMFTTFDPSSDAANYAGALMTYQIILDSTNDGRTFDFEGSMIPGIAENERSYNPILGEYYRIRKYSPRLTLYNNFRESISAIKNCILTADRRQIIK